jgi:hypothetical protein
MNWSAPPHAPDLCARWRRGIAGKSENHQQQQRARAAPRKRSVGRDARRDRIGEGRVTTHLTRRPLKFAAGRAGSQRRAPPAAAYRDRNLSPHGENAMHCRGVGVGVGAGNGRVARAHFYRRGAKRRAWLARLLHPLSFFRRSLPGFPAQLENCRT